MAESDFVFTREDHAKAEPPARLILNVLTDDPTLLKEWWLVFDALALAWGVLAGQCVNAMPPDAYLPADYKERMLARLRLVAEESYEGRLRVLRQGAN